MGSRLPGEQRQGARIVITLHVSTPPPLSAAFKNHRTHGRVKTKRYLTWQRVALNEVRLQERHLLEGPVRVNIEITRPSKRRMDLDNRLKCLLDFLSHPDVDVLSDDSQIVRLGIAWREGGEGVTIEVREA